MGSFAIQLAKRAGAVVDQPIASRYPWVTPSL